MSLGPGTLHALHSGSKSIVGLLYGVALQQGMVPPPETALFSVYPEQDGGKVNGRRSSLPRG
jgi:hypothetical protein